MGVPNSFLQFRDLLSSGSFEPSKGNLFSVEMGLPIMFQSQETVPNFRTDTREMYEAVNYLADSVVIPSRNVTTGEVKQIGMTRTYGTGQTANELSVSFLLTKNNWHRNFFEKWMNAIAPDNENRVAFYDHYTTDITVRKWETGSNIVAKTTVDGEPRYSRLNKATGVYCFARAFPFNISNITYSNEAQLMKMDVQFKYERYRFTTKVKRRNEWTSDIILDDFNASTQILSSGAFGIDTRFGV